MAASCFGFVLQLVGVGFSCITVLPLLRALRFVITAYWLSVLVLGLSGIFGIEYPSGSGPGYPFQDTASGFNICHHSLTVTGHAVHGHTMA